MLIILWGCSRRHTGYKNIDTTDMKEYKAKRVTLHASDYYVTTSDKLTDVLIHKGSRNLNAKIKNINIQQIELYM